jgi:hypothetical protein
MNEVQLNKGLPMKQQIDQVKPQTGVEGTTEPTHEVDSVISLNRQMVTNSSGVSVKRFKEYERFIKLFGVGSPDKYDEKTNDELKSYLMGMDIRRHLLSMKHVSKHSGLIVSDVSLRSQDDIDYFTHAIKLSNVLSPIQLNNCVSAMKLYVDMVNA